MALTALFLALMGGVAPAADDVSMHLGVSHRVVTIDGDLVRPSTLTMKTYDVLEFVNYSTVPMMLAFVEPQGHSDKARCHVTRLKSGRTVAPEMFTSGSIRQPTEIIPPGGFVSVCSLDRGHYVFVTKEVGMDAPAPIGKLGTKGTVTVE